jgi:hypothetical protein
MAEEGSHSEGTSVNGRIRGRKTVDGERIS